MTHQQLHQQANQLARNFVELQKTSNSSTNNIAVFMEPTERYIISMLAIWKAGGTYCPISTKSPAERNEEVIKWSKPLAVIVDENLQKFFLSDSYSATTTNIKTYQNLVYQEQDKDVSAMNLKSDEMLLNYETTDALLMFTSGTLHEILPLHISVKVLKFLGPPLHYLYVS